MVFGLLSSPLVSIALARELSEPSISFLMEASAAATALTAAMAAAAASACSFAICCDLATSTAWARPDARGTASEPERRLGLMRFRFGRPLVDDDVEFDGGDAILFMGELDSSRWDWGWDWDWGREFSRSG